MEPIKITFEKELTGLGKTFEREAVYGKPKIGEFYLGDLQNVELSDLNFKAVHYPILTPKKTTYTVIKVKGSWSAPKVEAFLPNGGLLHHVQVHSYETVTE